MIKFTRKVCFSLKALVFVLFFGILFSNSSFAATSSIIIDAESGQVLSASNADQSRYPASLTKLMTLYITFDALERGTIKKTDKLIVSRAAANRSPSRLGLKPGEKITVENAMMALIVKSANDCATVLAEGLGYSEEKFANTMTKVAKELGMKNTTFKNASGLPNRLQKTTARDMAILGAAVYHHFPQYYPLFATQKFTYKGTTMYSHNRILKTFDGADGMKTGYTNAAGYNIVTSAMRDGKRVIAVTMGHKTLKQRDTHITKMMSNGLNKLAMNDKAAKSNIYAKLEEKPVIEQTIAKEEKITTLDIIEEQTESPKPQVSNFWGIQIGAFSNYTKARNYALQVKEEIENKYQNTDIDVEAVSKNSAVVYRSKIVGFKKIDAQNACKGLKKTNKSCIVVAINKSKDLIMAQNEADSHNRNQ